MPTFNPEHLAHNIKEYTKALSDHPSNKAALGLKGPATKAAAPAHK